MIPKEQKQRALYNKRLSVLLDKWNKDRYGRAKIRMYKQQNGRCSLCDEPLLDFHKGRPTLDHQIPKSMGGTWAIANLRLAHQQCNIRRGNKPLEPRGEYAPLRLSQT